MKRIVFKGKDGSTWEFTELTTLPHPRTNDDKTLRVYAEAALATDDRLATYEIIDTDRQRAPSANNTPQRMARPSAGATYAGGDGSGRIESKGE
jgi:hypothetical protein